MISSLLHFVGLWSRVYYTSTNFRGGERPPCPLSLNTPMCVHVLSKIGNFKENLTGTRIIFVSNHVIPCGNICPPNLLILTLHIISNANIISYNLFFLLLHRASYSYTSALRWYLCISLHWYRND